MEILYGTWNRAKLEAMQRRLAPLGITLTGLMDVKAAIPKVEEEGKTPLENAKRKAMAYFKAFQKPVFSCDSGLYIEEVLPQDQPGVFVRRKDGVELSDEEMVEYYVNLYERYHKLTARYQNAICLILDEEHIYAEMNEQMQSKPFYITNQMRPIQRKGFPIDSISVDITTGRHFYDLPSGKTDQVAVEDGFLQFFEAHMDFFKDELI